MLKYIFACFGKRYKKKTRKSKKKQTKPKRKQKIPVALRNSIWGHYVGKNIAVISCPCCQLNELRITNFHASHIKAESRGGKTVLQNLLPLCASCNCSMGTEHMIDFMNRYGLDTTRIKEMIRINK